MERNKKKTFWTGKNRHHSKTWNTSGKLEGGLDFRKILRQNTAPLGGPHRTCFYSIKKCTTAFVLSGISRIYEMQVKKLFISLITIFFGKDISHLLRQMSDNEIAHCCYVNKKLRLVVLS